MKLNTFGFLHKCQHPLLLALGSIPVALLFIMNIAPELLDRMWLLPAAFVLLAWGCLLMPGKTRLIAGLTGTAALLAAGFMLLQVKSYPLLILLPLMYAVLLLMTLPIGGWSRERELNLPWYVVGVLFYVLLQMLINGSRTTGANTYEAAVTPMSLCFLGYAALVVLALNRTSLENAAMSRRQVPLLMRRQNILVTLGFMALGLLIAALPAIAVFLDRLWDLLMQGILLLGTLLATLMPQNQGGGGSGGPAEDMDSFAGGAAQQTSMLAIILEKVMTVFAIIAIVVLVYFAGRALLKRLIRLMKYLWLRMSHYGAAASEDYEDEITDTRDEADVERQSLFGRLRRMTATDDKALSPTERVRFRYRRLKQKHTDWSSAATARETLPDQAATLYERARYGGETLTEEDAVQFREETRRV